MKVSIPSIRHHLSKIAINEGKAFQLILTRYFQERLIYRLSISEYRSHFCLKGGTLLYAVEQEKSRPTLDIDFLAFDISNDQENFKRIFSEICLIEYANDCVTFNVSTISTSVITNSSVKN